MPKLSASQRPRLLEQAKHLGATRWPHGGQRHASPAQRGGRRAESGRPTRVTVLLLGGQAFPVRWISSGLPFTPFTGGATGCQRRNPHGPDQGPRAIKADVRVLRGSSAGAVAASARVGTGVFARSERAPRSRGGKASHPPPRGGHTRSSLDRRGRLSMFSRMRAFRPGRLVAWGCGSLAGPICTGAPVPLGGRGESTRVGAANVEDQALGAVLDSLCFRSRPEISW